MKFFNQHLPLIIVLGLNTCLIHVADNMHPLITKNDFTSSDLLKAFALQVNANSTFPKIAKDGFESLINEPQIRNNANALHAFILKQPDVLESWNTAMSMNSDTDINEAKEAFKKLRKDADDVRTVIWAGLLPDEIGEKTLSRLRTILGDQDGDMLTHPTVTKLYKLPDLKEMTEDHERFQLTVITHAYFMVFLHMKKHPTSYYFNTKCLADEGGQKSFAVYFQQ